MTLVLAPQHLIFRCILWSMAFIISFWVDIWMHWWTWGCTFLHAFLLGHCLQSHVMIIVTYLHQAIPWSVMKARWTWGESGGGAERGREWWRSSALFHVRFPDITTCPPYLAPEMFLGGRLESKRKRQVGSTSLTATSLKIPEDLKPSVISRGAGRGPLPDFSEVEVHMCSDLETRDAGGLTTSPASSKQRGELWGHRLIQRSN